MSLEASSLSIIRGGPLRKYQPKGMSIKQVYAHLNDKKGGLERHDHIRAKTALKEAGYTRTKITNLLDRHFEIPANEMRKIAGHLKDGNVSGFRDTNPQEAVKKFIHAEMVKGRSINIIKKEHQQEMQAEDLGVTDNATSMSSLERVTGAMKRSKPKLVK